MFAFKENITQPTILQFLLFTIFAKFIASIHATFAFTFFACTEVTNPNWTPFLKHFEQTIHLLCFLLKSGKKMHKISEKSKKKKISDLPTQIFLGEMFFLGRMDMSFSNFILKKKGKKKKKKKICISRPYHILSLLV